MKTNKQHALLLRFLDDALSDQEEKLLDDLLKSSPEARSDLEELVTMREAIGEYSNPSFSDGFAERVVSSTQSMGAENLNRPSPQSVAKIYSLHSGRLLRVAAIILLLVSISALVWIQPRTYTAPFGNQMSRLLPDGSEVLLSGGATLSYKPFWGRQERKVQLSGEAFFDVTKNSKAFVVETFNSEVRVLGTRFNVKAWPEHLSKYTSVVLEEGRVEVASLQTPADKHVLNPSESIIIAQDTTFPKKTLKLPTFESRLAWRAGGLSFEDELLVDVIAELGRRYNLRLTLSSRLGVQRITYFQPNQTSIDKVLTDISQPHSLAYRKIANGYEIYAP